MNPLLASALQSIFRAALLIGAGWFVKHGIWTDHDATEYVAAGAVALTAAAWGLWDKYSSARRQATTIAVANALTGPQTKSITSADIDAVIKKGDTAPASTPHDQAPELTGTGNGLSMIKTMTGTGNGL